MARPRPGQEEAYDIRIFNAADSASKPVATKNFTHLDPYPELILFEGSYNKREKRVDIIGKTHSMILQAA